MKRAGNLYPEICSAENIGIAYWKASRGKRLKRDHLLFRLNVVSNLEEIRKGLDNGTIPIGKYSYFTIKDPKERVICAASFPERIVHHAVMNVCERFFERCQFFHSYACRKGKGQHAALLAAFHYAKSSPFFMKMDVRKYFDSIDHGILLLRLKRLFKDSRLINLFERIIDSYHTAPGKGVPIGNLTSQYFANHYLAGFDHHVKEMLGARRYIRYMDDMVFFADSLADLKVIRYRAAEYLRRELALDIHEPVMNRCSHGVPFLGFLVKPHGVFMLRKSRVRFKIRTASYDRAYSAGMMSERALADRMWSAIQHTMIARSRSFRYAVFQRTYPSGSNRVKRGGSWNNNADNCRVANRNNNSPDNSNNNIGFRVVRRP